MKHLHEDLENNPYYEDFVDSFALLPCPFCGGEAESVEWGTGRRSFTDSNTKAFFTYGCTSCRIFLSKEKWNIRHKEAEPTDDGYEGYFE